MNDDKHNHIAPKGPVKKAIREHSNEWAQADRRRRDTASNDDRSIDGGSNDDRPEPATGSAIGDRRK